MGRSCGGSGAAEGCSKTSILGNSRFSCVCTGELCNGAGMAAVSTSLLMISVVISKML